MAAKCFGSDVVLFVKESWFGKIEDWYAREVGGGEGKSYLELQTRCAHLNSIPSSDFNFIGRCKQHELIRLPQLHLPPPRLPPGQTHLLSL
jgi:hypothetical protein